MPVAILALALGLLAVVALTRSASATAPGAPSSIDPDIKSDVNRWRALAETEGARARTTPELVLAIIARESRGNPSAIGGTDDFGLMQITRAAWQDYQAENNDPAANPFLDALLDPRINVRVGSWFLNRKLEEMGDLYNGVRAYNCGTVGAKASPSCGATYANWVVQTGIPAFRSRV